MVKAVACKAIILGIRIPHLTPASDSSKSLVTVYIAPSVKQKILEFLSDDFVDYDVDIQESHDVEFTFVTTVSGKTYCVKETPVEIESQL